jgi:ribosomal protein S18 acetylase RimI-like enzyme
VAGGGEQAAAVTLRPAGAADQELLYAVYASTRAEELAQTAWSDGEKAAFLRAQFEAQHRCYHEGYAGAAFDVVLVDGRPAGRLYVARGSEEIRIVDVALLPAFRGRGVGGRLLGALLREGDERGLPVRIHVERFNPALRFYERLGFRLVADGGVYLFLEKAPSVAARASAG